jgi:purine-cytosine permease-like protein
MLSARAPFDFLLRSITAHFVVSCAAGAFVVLSVAGIQGLALAAAGPRTFSRVAPALQVGLVGVVALGLLVLPTLNISAVDTLRAAGRNISNPGCC